MTLLKNNTSIKARGTTDSLWVLRHSGRVALLVVVLLVAAGLAGPTLHSSNAPEEFLAPDDPQLLQNQSLVEHFGALHQLVVVYQGEQALSQETLDPLNALADKVNAVPGVSSVLHAQSLGGRELAGLEAWEGVSPLSKVMRFLDIDRGLYTFLVHLEDPDRLQRLDTSSRIEALVHREFPDQHWTVVGQDTIDHALDESETEVRRKLMPWLVLIMALILLLAFRDLRATLAILLTVGASEAAVVCILAAFGRPLNLVTVLLPVLLLALAVALNVHVVTHVRAALDSGRSLRNAISLAARGQLRPCFWTASTTAIGFGSLALSEIAPLKILGLATALAILISFALGFSLLPVLLLWLRARPRSGLKIGPLLRQHVPGLVRRPLLWGTPAALLCVSGIWCMTQLHCETNGLKFFDSHHEVRRSVEFVDAQVMGTTGVEVLLLPRREALQSDERDQLADAAQDDPCPPLAVPDLALQRAHELLSEVAGNRGVLSELTLLQESMSDVGGRGSQPTALLTAQMQDQLSRYRAADGSRRLALRLNSSGQELYIRTEADLVRAKQQLEQEFPQVECILTGAFPIIMRVQQEVLSTLLQSLALSLAIITGLLAVLFRKPTVALLSLLPAFLPLAAIGLLAWLLDLPLNIGTAMVFSVSLGIAVDDAIHILHGALLTSSLQELMGQVGEAVASTSLVTMAGFAVLMTSSFQPTHDFGLLAAGAMAVAFWANVVVLPGCLMWRRGSLSTSEIPGRS